MKNTTVLRTWLDEMNLTHPLVIAGPCSAETEEQVLKIAHELKDSDVNYYRAGTSRVCIKKYNTDYQFQDSHECLSLCLYKWRIAYF